MDGWQHPHLLLVCCSIFWFTFALVGFLLSILNLTLKNGTISLTYSELKSYWLKIILWENEWRWHPICPAYFCELRKWNMVTMCWAQKGLLGLVEIARKNMLKCDVIVTMNKFNVTRLWFLVSANLNESCFLSYALMLVFTCIIYE